MANEVNLTPNYNRIFAQMLQEARRQGEASAIVYDVHRIAARVDVLRAVQRFIGPLAIAASCMTSVAEVELFREALATINTGIDTHAGELETAAQARDDKRLESCPKCGAVVSRGEASVDEGEGPESGRTFYYCSEHCRETH